MPFTPQGAFSFLHTNQSDTPNVPASTLKTQWDTQSSELKSTLNNLIIALEKSSETSGAEQIGSLTITDLTGTTIYAQLLSLRDKLKSISDGSSGADFINATAITGLTGGTVQSLLEALKVYTDSLGTALTGALTTHKTSGDHDGRYFTETEIQATTDGSSGADRTGATQVSPGSGTTVQSIVEWLYQQIVNVVIGDIPDGSIADNKLSNAPTGIKTRFSKGVPLVYNVNGYGALGDGSDETSEIQNTINAAIAANSKSVFFPSGVYSATALTGLGNVVLFGDNASLTVGGVDTEVKQFGLGSSGSGFLYNRALNAQTVPINALANATKALVANGVLRVLFIGDSITETGDLGDRRDTYANRVIASLTKALPGVTITFENMALGARWLALFNDSNYKGVASEPAAIADGFFRSWSTVGMAWKDSAKNFNPDLVILAFGMNDAFGNSPTIDNDFAAGLNTALTTINSWASAPSTVLVTSILPTTNTALYPQRQDSTNSVVRATRLVAKQNNLAVADASQLFRILRDGLDELTRSSESEKNWVGYPTGWSGSTTGYSLSTSILTPSTGGIINRDRTFYNGTILLTTNPGQVGDNGITQIHYRDSDLGKFTVYVGAGTGSTGYVRLYTYEVATGYVQLQEVTGLTIQVGSDTAIKIVVEDNNHKVYINNVLQLDQTVYNNLHDGEVSMGSVVSPYATLKNLNIYFSDPASEDPLFTEADLLGLHASPYDAGNGVNHPSPLGHALFYLSSFNAIIDKLTHAKALSQNSYSGMGRQAAKNANMVICQEGTSFVNPTNSLYTLEMYLCSFVLGGGTAPTTITHSQDLITSGELAGSKYAYKIAWNGAGSSFGATSLYNITQRMEHTTRNLAGANKKVTVSFMAKSDISSKRIAVGMRQVYGSGGSPSVTEILTPTSTTIRTLSSSWSLYTFTFATNTLVGKTFGTNNDDYLQVEIYQMWGTTVATNNLGGGTAETFVGSGYTSIAQLVVNAGAFPLPFEPVDPERDLMQCQRYFEKSFEPDVVPADAIIAGAVAWRGLGGSFDSVYVPFKVTKRISPTVLFYNPVASSSSKIRNDSAGTNLAASGDVSTNSVTIYPNGVVTASGNVLKVHFTAIARL